MIRTSCLPPALALFTALLAPGGGYGGVIAVDAGVPAVMNAGGTAADPAVYHVGVAPAVSLDLTAVSGYLGQTNPYNRLVVDHGARLSVRLRVGENVSAPGNSILVSGANTQLSVYQFSFFGLGAGQNQLRIEKGGRMISGSSWFGYNNTSHDNAAVISGTGSGWEVSTLGIGSSGSRNSLRIEDGGEIKAHTVALGSTATATENLVVVDGASSRLEVTAAIYVGSQGRNNRLEARQGGRLSAGDLILGSETVGSGNQVLLDGAGTRLQATTILVGGTQSPSNSLVIGNRAEAVATSCTLGMYEAGDLNQLRVDGAGSSLQLDGDLAIGVRGDENVLRISAGGELRNRNAWVGQGDEGNPIYGTAVANRAVIEDSGSKWIVAKDLSIGEYGTGNVVEIRRGGLVVVEGALEIDKLRRGGNGLVLDGGYLAWKGDQTPHVGKFAGLVTDTRATTAGAFGYQYFATEAAAQTATGYPGLGGYTVLGAGVPQVPPTVTDWRLRIPNPRDSSNDEFPSSVAVRGRYALVGATTAVTDVGAAYLIDLDTGALVREFAPPATNIGERPAFGNTVALTDRHAIIGASDKDRPENAFYAGAVYVFDRATGALVHDLRPLDQTGGQRFGASVSADGNLLLVGAWGDRSGMGAGYLFNLETGAQLAKLTAPTRTGVRMGARVALHGPVAALTAPFGGRTHYAEGQIWLFDVSDPLNPSAATLIPHPRLAELDYQESAGFGSGLALRNGLLLAGAPGESSDADEGWAGAAYLIDVSNVQLPRVLERIVAPDPAANDSFGDSVAISGNTAVISNAFIDRPTGNAGEVRVFDLSNPTLPVDLGAIAAPPGDHAFGSIVTIDGNRVVAGTRSSSGIIVGALHSHLLPDPQVTVTTSAATVITGSVTHTVKVSNPGPVDITGLELNCGFGISGSDGATVGEVTATLGTVESGTWRIARLRALETAELRVTYTADHQTETAGLVATSASITDSTEFLTGRQDDTATVETRIVGVVIPKTVRLDAYPVVNRQTGLMVQRVAVTNQGDVALNDWWLTVTGLPANVEVRNASGQDDTGRAFLTGPPLAAGAEVILSVEFYSPVRDPRLEPQYGIGFPPAAARAAEKLAVQPGDATPPRLARQSDGTMLFEFSAAVGHRYRIEYSRDLSDWQPAGAPVTATTARMQWIDRGPPETESPPADVQARFYRLVPVDGGE